jgi:hypothetical protein
MDPTAGLNMVINRRIAARNYDASFSNMTIRIVQSCFAVYQSPILRQHMSKYYTQKCIYSRTRDNLGIRTFDMKGNVLHPVPCSLSKCSQGPSIVTVTTNHLVHIL